MATDYGAVVAIQKYDITYAHYTRVILMEHAQVDSNFAYSLGAVRLLMKQRHGRNALDSGDISK